MTLTDVRAPLVSRLPAVFGWTDEGRDVVADAVSVHRMRVADAMRALLERVGEPTRADHEPPSTVLGQLAPVWAAADHRARSRVTLAPATSRRLLWTPHRLHEACRWITGSLAHESAVDGSSGRLRRGLWSALGDAHIGPGSAARCSHRRTPRRRVGRGPVRRREWGRQPPGGDLPRTRGRWAHSGGRAEPPRTIRPLVAWNRGCRHVARVRRFMRARVRLSGSVTRSPPCRPRPRWRQRSWSPSRSRRGDPRPGVWVPPRLHPRRRRAHRDQGPAVSRRHEGANAPGSVHEAVHHRCNVTVRGAPWVEDGAVAMPNRVPLDGQPASVVAVPAGLPRVGRPAHLLGPCPREGHVRGTVGGGARRGCRARLRGRATARPDPV